MTLEQALVFSIIAVAMAMFVWDRFRYDLVAVLALVAGVLSGVVQAERAFEGFGHAAVITVAAVLIISRALQISGVVDTLAQLLAPTLKTTTHQVAGSGVLVAGLSCVMNNVGALALMLPVTLQNAIKSRVSPSQVLIPLSFASLLGGLVTLIGTPPNIVISSFRQETVGKPFSMFDFTPVGLSVALAGLVYLSFIGWRLLPERVVATDEDQAHLHAKTYSLETRIPEGSPIAGMRVREFETTCDLEVAVLAIIRDGVRRLAPHPVEKFREGDILILQGDPALVQPLADGTRLALLGHDIKQDRLPRSEDVVIAEAVLKSTSPIHGRSMRGVRLHDRYGINLLAVSRDGRPATARLKNTTFKAGDVLLLQGESQQLELALRELGCLLLANRGLQSVPPASGSLYPVSIFAVAIIVAAFGWVPVPVAFVCAAVMLVLVGAIPLSEIYQSIEWPVIVLLACLIPLGEALQHTGGTDLAASALLNLSGEAPVWMLLALILATSMWLSDLVHNTPTAVLMAPVAVSIANGLSANPDGFLMAVAVGAASPYLTPIGHQSNTLVMGPGGYSFIDYTRVGAPLQAIIMLIAVPAIMLVWPPL